MKTSSLVKIALFSAITAVLSQVTVPIGPVPISLGTLAVYLSAVFLNPRDAFLSQVLYLLLGVIGLPVFSNLGSGIGHLMGPTGGFAFSFPFVAFITSVALKKANNFNDGARITFKIIGLVVATLVCYILGVMWFMKTSGLSLSASLPLVLFPFLIGDTVKIVISLIISEKTRNKFNNI